ELIAAIAAARGVPSRDPQVVLAVDRLELAAHPAADDVALEVVGRRAADWLLDQIKDDMHRLRVDMQHFVSERELHESGVVRRAIGALEESGHIYDAEGATWFRSSAFGDEKDRVVQRSDGDLTYFAADIGYHRQKFERGYDQLIDVWGADHHGHIKRMAAA